MECKEFRQLIGADPAGTDLRAEQHRDSCPACKAYAERLIASEGLINRALRFDVQALKQQVELQRQPKRTNRFAAFGGAAAAMIAAVAVWVLVQPVGDSGALAADVAEHWHHEPYSWQVTDVSVPDFALRAVLAGKARLDLQQLGPVTYVASCPFRGHIVPHLVVQGQAGPVMILLLPEEAVNSIEAVTLEEEGLSGVIVPHGGGSVAILGAAAEPMAPLQKSLVNAVEWSI